MTRSGAASSRAARPRAIVTSTMSGIETRAVIALPDQRRHGVGEAGQIAGVGGEVSPADHTRRVDGERRGGLPAVPARPAVVDALVEQPADGGQRAPAGEVLAVG